jgi:hypothetical protein
LIVNRVFGQYYSEILRGDFTQADNLMQEQTSLLTIPGESGTAFILTQFLRQIDQLARAASPRSLFVLADGSIGSGPRDMVLGDRIAHVAGVDIPLVLRRCRSGSGRYTILGKAFVLGPNASETSNLQSGDQNAWGEAVLI